MKKWEENKKKWNRWMTKDGKMSYKKNSKLNLKVKYMIFCVSCGIYYDEVQFVFFANKGPIDNLFKG